MIQKLIDIYEQSKLNKGIPECIFPETEIFNEGWLLRGILNSLMGIKDIKDTVLSDFLPFPDDSKRYSEGRLDTPFKPRFKGDSNYTETQTPIDGIVGHFEIYGTKKSGIKISDNFNYLSIFEAKMYSSIGKGKKEVPNFSQVTRIISCMIFQIMKIEKLENKKIFLVILYPDDHANIDCLKYTNQFIKDEIKERLKNYKNGFEKNLSPDLIEFESKYEKTIEMINIRFITWEQILNEIKTDTLIIKFYDLCKKFNKKGNKNYVLREYSNPLDELLKRCPVRHKKSKDWISKNCISKNEPPQKCISTGNNGGLPVKTSDGFYVKLSPKYDSDFWSKLPQMTS